MQEYGGYSETDFDEMKLSMSRIESTHPNSVQLSDFVRGIYENSDTEIYWVNRLAYHYDTEIASAAKKVSPVKKNARGVFVGEFVGDAAFTRSPEGKLDADFHKFPSPVANLLPADPVDTASKESETEKAKVRPVPKSMPVEPHPAVRAF
jgi:hypothetical protein